jgi:alpha-L-arabinofuranosidase
VQALFSRNRPDRVLPVQIAQPLPTAIGAEGPIGVGTWNTQAEFKDIKVTRNGETLFESNFGSGLEGWKTSRGSWSVSKGALQQTLEETDVQAVAGQPDWTDYAYSLKARKLGGREGFLILFQVPADGTRNWWNLGGWRNTAHGLQGPGFPDTRVKGSIETGRWYDIRIELKGSNVKCYLDGKLVQEATRRIAPTLYAVAGRDDETNELIVTVVNAGSQEVEAIIELRGLQSVASEASVVVLTSPHPDDENSNAEPDKVVPREERVKVPGPEFSRSLPANSVTLMRVRAGD